MDVAFDAIRDLNAASLLPVRLPSQLVHQRPDTLQLRRSCKPQARRPASSLRLYTPTSRYQRAFQQVADLLQALDQDAKLLVAQKAALDIAGRSVDLHAKRLPMAGSAFWVYSRRSGSSSKPRFFM